MNHFLKSPFHRLAGSLRLLVVSLLAGSAFALLLAPSQMPASYSWLRHTTSESAAQGIPNAWLARLGFLIFGLTVMWISDALQHSWSSPVRWLHTAFGVLMVATAAFSTQPWLSDITYDPVEDGLHSFTATAMGFAFLAAVLLRLLQRRRERLGRVLDLGAVIAATVIPLAMNVFPEWDGLFQRGMFAIAYIWYGFEYLNQRGGMAEPQAAA